MRNSFDIINFAKNTIYVHESNVFTSAILLNFSFEFRLVNNMVFLSICENYKKNLGLFSVQYKYFSLQLFIFCSVFFLVNFCSRSCC